MSETELRPIRQCRAKLTDLADALDMGNMEMTAYLDLETGEVLFVSDEARRELERFYESMPEEIWLSSEEEQEAAIVAALEECRSYNVEDEELVDARAVEAGLNTRFVELPEVNSHEGYRDMEAFIDTVTTPRLQRRLDSAIRGRGAFRRFKDELFDDPAERERWFAYKQERHVERIRRWLARERIDLMEGSD